MADDIMHGERMAQVSGDESWWERGGSSADVCNAMALAKLAVRLAATARPNDYLVARGPGSQERSDSEGDPGYRLADPRLEEYYRVVDVVSTKYKRNGDGTESNDAVASCVQFVTHCIRATVDPDCHQMSPRDAMRYFAQSNKWRELGEFDRGDVEGICVPGDVICYLDGSHTSLYVGHELIAKKFPAADATTNVCEARYTSAAYPECVTYSTNEGYPGHESTRIAVYRFAGVRGGCLHPYINVWKLLRGDADYLF